MNYVGGINKVFTIQFSTNINIQMWELFFFIYIIIRYPELIGIKKRSGSGVLINFPLRGGGGNGAPPPLGSSKFLSQGGVTG